MQPESPTHPDAPRARRRTLKVYPEYFDALESGEKSFEFRKDDREPRYAVGDTLVLREWDPTVDRDEFMGDFTGRECLRRVTYVARGRFIPEGFCVMSIVPLRPDAPRAGGETPAPSETHAPRTYQSAWAWDDSVDSDSPPPMMRTAEEWLRVRKPYVQRQMADGDDETLEDDDLPDRAGIMEAIAKEIDTIRRERTQWAEAFTKLRADHDALRASLLERHRDGERAEPAASPEPGDV